MRWVGGWEGQNGGGEAREMECGWDERRERRGEEKGMRSGE